MADRYNERMLRTLLGNLPGMAYRCANRPGWTMEFVSEGCLELTGHPADVLMREAPPAFGDLIHLDDQERVWTEVQDSVTEGVPFVIEYRIITAAGDERWVWERGRSVEVDEAGDDILEGFITDITDRIRLAAENAGLEARYRQAQKLEAIGGLAGGIAHDFNNLLTVINSYAALAADDLRDVARVRNDLAQILKAGERAAELTHQLLAFSRSQVLAPRILDLNAVVRGLEDMLRRVIGDETVLKTSLAAKLGPVLADPGQLEQVIMNLVINARDAMPQGGTVEISTAKARTLSEKQVVLVISDQGEGMTDAVLRRAFEPFFTTKEPGRGTGLGLATVYGIVKQSGGDVQIKTTRGEGTSVRITLPAADGDLPRTPRPREVTGRRGTETILVVEDEDSVRSLLEELLTDAGYTVIAAGHPDDAVRLYREVRGRVGGLLTDITMPGMRGDALAALLRKDDPALPVLYISGHAGSLAPTLTSGRDPSGLVTKPFTADRLLSALRRLLDGAARPRPTRRGD